MHPDSVPTHIELVDGSRQVYNNALQGLINATAASPQSWIKYFQEKASNLPEDTAELARLARWARAALFVVQDRSRQGPEMTRLLAVFRSAVEGARSFTTPQFKRPQLTAMVPYKDIQKRVAATLEGLDLKTAAPREMRYVAFASLMVLENNGAPRRDDYLSLKPISRLADADSGTGNYYHLKTHKIILKDYKTFKVYGAYIFVVRRAKLRAILERLATEHNGIFATMVTTDAFRYSAGVVCHSSLLRKIAVTDAFREDQSLAFARRLAERMGHSVSTQQRDYSHVAEQYEALPRDAPQLKDEGWTPELLQELYQVAREHGTTMKILKEHASPLLLLRNAGENGWRVKMQKESTAMRMRGDDDNPFFAVKLTKAQEAKLNREGIPVFYTDPRTI